VSSSTPQLVAGVDITAIPEFEHLGVVSYTLVKYPEEEVVGFDDCVVFLPQPYIPEYLAIREAAAMANSVRRVQLNSDETLLLVDGNGILHSRGFQFSILSIAPGGNY